MQIVSEAVFQNLKQSTLLHIATHNRLAYVTSSELVVRDLNFSRKGSTLKIRGADVIALSLENQHYIVILYKSGKLEVRKIDILQELWLTVTDILIRECLPKIKVTSEAIYVLSTHYVERIEFSLKCNRQKISLGQKLNDNAEDMLISSVLQEQKIIIYQFQNFVSFTIQGVPIARLDFKKVNEIKLLRDPLLIGDVKEYLLVLDMNKWLKIYDLINLQQILEMELFLEKDEKVQLKVDPLHEYLVMRVYKQSTKKTVKNSLLKINKEYYLGETKDPFFLFDIELGIVQDLILFPTHLEIIKGVKFHSIDMCFFTNKEIKIATLVIDINHRTKLHHTFHIDPHWKSITHWKDIISSLQCSQSQEVFKRQYKKTEIQQKNSNGVEWDKFLNKFLIDNLQNLKNEGVLINVDRNSEQKYLEYSGSKLHKDIAQYQDALNTLSGSQSFRSLGSGTHEIEERLIKMIEGDYSSEGLEEEKVFRQCSINQDELDQQQSEQSAQQYLMNVQANIGQLFKPIQQKVQQANLKFDRMYDVHVKKLSNIEKSIRSHTKEAVKIEQKIPIWCGEQMKIFSSEVKDSLKKFSSIINCYELIGSKKIKKIKKYYRDFISQEIQVCQQKLQESEISSLKVEALMKKLDTE